MIRASRLAVVGGGAVGTVLADAAERAGLEVTLCVRSVPDTLELRTTAGDTRRLGVRVTADASSVGVQEWVLLATKAHDSATVAPWLDRLASDRTIVVACQNGIRHVRRIGPLAPMSVVIPAVVAIVAERISPGLVVHRAGRGLTVPDGDPGRALRELFPGAELEIRLDADIDRAVWLKFMGNIAAAPVTTLTSRRMDVLREPEVQGLLRGLLAEALAVGLAEGIDLSEPDADTMLRLLADLDQSATTSMQADRAAGRSLEVEELNGALVRVADEHAIATPINRTVLSLLRCLRPTEE